MSEQIDDRRIAYSEAEAAEVLHMKSERALADFRRKYLVIGKHYAKTGRVINYTPEHLRNILHMDARKAA